MQLNIALDDVGGLMTFLNRNGVASTTSGFDYDIEAGVLTYPDAHASLVAGYDADGPATPTARLSFLEFMDLFTEQEQRAIAGAAMTDVSTKLWYDRAVGAQFIALDDPRLAAGLQAMVDSETLSAQRRDRVLLGLAPEA